MKKQFDIYNSGIYTITNFLDGKMIVGYTNNFTKRKNWHFDKLKTNSHANTYLQRSVNKYGIENFVFEILEELPQEKSLLAALEHYWATILNTHNREYGYNLQPTNPNNFRVHSKETLEKMSKANKNKKWTKEHKDKFIKSRKDLNWKPSLEMVKRFKETFSKPIIQYDMQGIIIEEYKSITEAGNKGFGKKYISLCCKNKIETYKGFIWKFKNLENENKNN